MVLSWYTSNVRVWLGHDAEFSDYLQSIRYCTTGTPSTAALLSELSSLWITPTNPNQCLPCLSVRTGLDLYFRARQFPVGSEVITSAVNIPSISQLIHVHGLKVVPLDIDIDTMAPRLDLLEQLITPRSRVLLLANVYGRGFCLDEYIEVAARHGLEVIEDWAEGFSGFHYVGHPQSDLALFSFGPIKYYTAFGGCMAKIRDPKLYVEMKEICDKYPRQTSRTYLKKLIKYLPVYLGLNHPLVTRSLIFLADMFNVDYKKEAVNLLRGFPLDKLLVSLRYFPSDALLAMMTYRMKHCDGSHIAAANEKAEFVFQRLPESMRPVGKNTLIRNYWLFPVIVDNPDQAILSLSAVGIDAYRGATQLNVVEPDIDSTLLQHPVLSDSGALFLRPNNTHSSAVDVPFLSESSFSLSHCNDDTEQTGRLVDLKSVELSLIGSSLPQNCDRSEELTSHLTNTVISQKLLVNQCKYYPHNARYLIDHVIYLPVTRLVPISALDAMCKAMHYAMSKQTSLFLESSKPNQILLRSKL